MAKREQSVLMAMVARGGWRNAFKALGYVGLWGVANADRETPMSQRAFSRFWNQNLSSTVRQVNAFKQCVPEGVTVEDVWAMVGPHVEYFSAKAGVSEKLVERAHLVASEVGSARWSL